MATKSQENVDLSKLTPTPQSDINSKIQQEENRKPTAKEQQQQQQAEGRPTEELSTDEYPEKERKRLSHFLHVVKPQVLRHVLLDKLNKDPEMLKAEMTLFPASEFPGDSFPKVHCVRCHEEFDPCTASDNDCIIEHGVEMKKIWQGPGGSHWKYLCCGLVVHSDFDDSPPTDTRIPYCFSGRHTTHPEEVAYNMHSVKACSELGCEKAKAV